jgi:hypothetical protein
VVRERDRATAGQELMAAAKGRTTAARGTRAPLAMGPSATAAAGTSSPFERVFRRTAPAFFAGKPRTAAEA